MNYKEKLFYLHIPKTAGSAMNEFLTSQYGVDESLVHIESKVDLSKRDDVVKIQKYKLLAGHFLLPQLIQAMNILETRTTIATFRAPIEHVISHIAWVRKLGDEGEEGRLSQHNTVVRKIVQKLLHIDLSQANEIDIFVKWLETEKISLFHNTQTRYLSGGGIQLGANHINMALYNLNRIHFVGISERLMEFKALLCGELGFHIYEDPMKKVNVNASYYGLDISNEEIRRALQPLIGWDQLIYRMARERFVDDMHRFLAKIEKQRGPRFSSVKEQWVINQFKGEK